MTGGHRARLARALGIGLTLSFLLLTACSQTHIPQDTFHPDGPVARKEANLYWVVFWIATVVFVLVEGALVVAMVKFRHRPGRGVPKQIHGNRLVEITWTVAPALLLAGLAVPTVAEIFDLASRPPNAVQITVVGHQWWWEVDYPFLRVTTANEIHVPVGQWVDVALTSGPSGSIGEGVIHSFWIPRLAGKQDLEPGRTTRMKFLAEKPGVYLGQCAEYCGTSHANMRLRVFAQVKSDFDAWVQQQLQKAPPPEPPVLDALGAGGCGGCHTIEGVDSMGGVVGPDLTHFGSRTTFAGAILRNTPANLTRWLLDPQEVKPGNDMLIGPGGQPGRSVLTDDQIQVLVRYLEALK